jgi:hypothetical protein
VHSWSTSMLAAWSNDDVRAPIPDLIAHFGRHSSLVHGNGRA